MNVSLPNSQSVLNEMAKRFEEWEQVWGGATRSLEAPAAHALAVKRRTIVS